LSNLDLKLARLATNLLMDLNEVDAINFDRNSANDQKAQLIVEAFEEAFRMAAAQKPVPASLIDRGP
jgi:hypothetical protein